MSITNPILQKELRSEKKVIENYQDLNHDEFVAINNNLQRILDAERRRNARQNAEKDKKIHRLELQCSQLEQTTCELYNRFRSTNEEIQRLRIAVDQDPMTGLYNKECFLGKLESHIESLQKRYKEGSNVEQSALFFVDLMEFAKFNREYGHPSGDEGINAVAAALGGCRPGDVVARYGGDEFVGYLARMGTNHTEYFSRVFQGIDGWCRERQTLPVFLNVGVVLLDDPFTMSSPENRKRRVKDLIWLANTAMYAAKDFCYYGEHPFTIGGFNDLEKDAKREWVRTSSGGFPLFPGHSVGVVTYHPEAVSRRFYNIRTFMEGVKQDYTDQESIHSYFEHCRERQYGKPFGTDPKKQPRLTSHKVQLLD